MSQLLAASIGSYPRTGENKDQQRYPRALGHFERKEISAHALRDVEQSVVQEIIREQLDAGVDEATDGLIAWPDPISRFTRHLTNVGTGGLARYFDNNFYFRVPTISGKPKIGPAVSGPEFRFAKSVSNKPIRAVLTGPVTLAAHTRADAKPYDKLPTRVELFTEVIAQEVAALAAEGATLIQIDEPALVSSPQHLPLFSSAAKALAAAKGGARLALALYYGSPVPLLDALGGLPFDVWHLEALSDLSDIARRTLSAPSGVSVGLGILDGRTTRMEAAEGLVSALNGWANAADASGRYLSTSCGLELLPRPAAVDKLRRLVEIRRQLGGVVVGGPHA